MIPEFQEFPKIIATHRVDSREHRMTITQKIHGTNAQVCVFENESGELDLWCGSRRRLITPQDDNFGFAAFVYSHKQEFIDKLGKGRHYGEWAGPGVNNHEGLEHKTFILFDHRRFPGTRPLPPRTKVVPVLYDGALNFEVLPEILADLKTNGSKLSPGHMEVEGVVVSCGDFKIKKVFEPEETGWKKRKSTDGKKVPKQPFRDCTHLCQPERLNKVVTSDEALLRNYPKTIKQISELYIKDLLDEGQITGTDEEVKGMLRDVRGYVFPFIKAQMPQILGGVAQ